MEIHSLVSGKGSRKAHVVSPRYMLFGFGKENYWTAFDQGVGFEKREDIKKEGLIEGNGFIQSSFLFFL
jgi:hypothetical protein